jgi:hypothetical protein
VQVSNILVVFVICSVVEKELLDIPDNLSHLMLSVFMELNEGKWVIVLKTPSPK